jgi:hypothetical protein
MAENSPSQPTENGEPETDVSDGERCPSCRGRGRKFVMLRRSEAAAGAAAETALLGRTQEQCLSCSGTGKAAS